MLEINESKIYFDKEKSKIVFSGKMRLESGDYPRLEEFLYSCLEKTPKLTICIQELVLLSSSGISLLTRFILKMKKQAKNSLKIIYQENIMWQQKVVILFNKLWQEVELVKEKS